MLYGRLLVGDPVQWLAASPIYVVLGLLLSCWLAFRASPGAPLRRWRWVLLAGLAWAYVTASPAVANRMLLSLESQYAPPVLGPGQPVPRRIVVLTSGEPFDPASPEPLQLDLASLRRTRAAVAFYRRHGGELIFVGARFPSERRSVAARMAGLAVQEGVPASAVRTLPGATTYRSLEYLSRDKVADEPFFLITSAAHMPRAMAVAHALHLTPIPVPCDYRALRWLGWQGWVPNNAAFPVISLALHEIVGRWYYELRGRV